MSKSIAASRPAFPRAMLSVLAGLLLIGGPTLAVAHHSFAAEFDADKPLDLKGVVTKFRLVNPHSWLYFDVTDKSGNVTNWGVEAGTPNALANKGLKKEDLKVGTEVRIKGYLAKNGGHFGYAVTVTLSDGRTFQTGGAQDSPALAVAR
jgi:hypothetical protein